MWPLTSCVSHLETHMHQITHSKTIQSDAWCANAFADLSFTHSLSVRAQEMLYSLAWFLFYYLFNDGVMKDSWIMFSREHSHHLKCMDGHCGGLTRSQSGKQTGKVIEIHCFCMCVICYQIRSCMPILTRTGLFPNLQLNKGTIRSYCFLVGWIGAGCVHRS